MEGLPDIVYLTDCRSGAGCEARLVELTRKLAATQIDGRWWSIDDDRTGPPRAEEDHHWVWRKLVGEHRQDLAWEFVAVQTYDHLVQGAAAYRIDFHSFVNPELTSVYVERIAVAPWNRPWVVVNPRYRGVGTALLLRVVCHSYLLGLGGRVNLVSLPSERTRTFYERRGFVGGGADEQGLIEYELSDEAAQQWLQQAGYLE